jgi:hypothetical protein
MNGVKQAMTLEVATPDVVEADVNYLRYDGRRPSSYAYPPPPGVPQRTGIPDVRRVQIANARQLATPPTLDVYGFELRSHRTEVGDFDSEDQIRTVYYREAEQILRRATGAEKVVIFDHTLRSSADQRAEGTREPVRTVHTTRPSCPARGACATTCRPTRPSCGFASDSRSSTCGARSASRSRPGRSPCSTAARSTLPTSWRRT